MNRQIVQRHLQLGNRGADFWMLSDLLLQRPQNLLSTLNMLLGCGRGPDLGLRSLCVSMANRSLMPFKIVQRCFLFYAIRGYRGGMGDQGMYESEKRGGDRTTRDDFTPFSPPPILTPAKAAKSHVRRILENRTLYGFSTKFMIL